MTGYHAPPPLQPAADRWSPWWAITLTVLACVGALVLLIGVALGLWIYFAGLEFGFIGLAMAMVFGAGALVVAVPAVGYLRTRRQGWFIATMVVVAILVAGWASLQWAI